MTDTLFEILCGVLALLGAGFTLLAAIGLIRFPDVYSRMHAATKAGVMGGGLVLIAVAIQASALDVTLRALAGVVFLIITGPIAAHLLGRAAYTAGVPLWSGGNGDELKGRYRDKAEAPEGAGLRAADYE